MGKIDFHVAHTLPLAEAKKRMERLTAYWAKHGIQSTWAGDEAKLHGRVMGIHLDATLRVTDKTVGGEATDPGLLLRGPGEEVPDPQVRDLAGPEEVARGAREGLSPASPHTGTAGLGRFHESGTAAAQPSHPGALALR